MLATYLAAPTSFASQQAANTLASACNFGGLKSILEAGVLLGLEMRIGENTDPGHWQTPPGVGPRGSANPRPMDTDICRLQYLRVMAYVSTCVT